MTPPNILFLMADQMAAPALRLLGGEGAKTPNLDALAARGAFFENAYCNYPLCAPSRFSMMTGQLASRIGAFDNAAELPAATPTFAHYLRAQGYQTCLVGKMHFIGPDQLHGFEERLTTEIYPADFGWTGDWSGFGEGLAFSRFAGISGVETFTDAGTCTRSMQLDFDEGVASRAVRKLFDLARSDDRRPFLLTVSFTHPHDPYVIPARYWDLYDDGEIPPARVAPLSQAAHDPHSRFLQRQYKLDEMTIGPDQVRAARHGYFGAISYVDERIGDLLAALEEAGLAANTAIVFVSDHGDMMGERGMIYKKTFYEWAMRVPLILVAPGGSAGVRPRAPVSLVDLLPTLLDLAGVGRARLVEPPAGESLVPLLNGAAAGPRPPVLAEHLDEGAEAPRVMVRAGRFKYVASRAYPAQLFDLAADPNELRNLAGEPALRAEEERLAGIVAGIWDLEALEERVVLSQRRRLLVCEAMARGQSTTWDYTPPSESAHAFVRFGDRFPEVEQARYLGHKPAAR